MVLVFETIFLLEKFFQFVHYDCLLFVLEYFRLSHTNEIVFYIVQFLIITTITINPP